MSIVAKKIMMGSGGGVDLPSDDQFNRVSFLSHFDGANNGVNNAFDDGSSSNHTITANGNVTQGSFGPFARPDGEWGVTFDGAADYLSAPNSSDWALANGEFTIEAWVFIKPSGSVKQAIVGHWTNGSRGWQARVEPSGSGYKLRWSWTTNGSEDSVLVGSIVADFNTWNHVAWVRASNTVTLYVNGVAGGTVSGANIFTPNTPLVIGDWDSNAADLNGVISNLRLVKGTAVYTGNFTPSTSKLTAVTNTKLLTCQSNRFVDNSASAHTLTPSNNTAVTAFGPFLTSSVYDPAVNGASAYFDGNVDRLHTPEDASTRVAASNFTFEAWVYPTTTTSANDMIFTQGAPGVYSPFNVYIVGTTVRIYISTNGTSWNIASNSTSSNSVQINAWNHIALVRNGTTIGLYINGVADNTYAVSTTAFFTPTRETSVGGRDGEEYFTGYITDARLVIGTAVYTSAFTPPTAPLTAVTNTKLLLSMKNGQAIDSTAQNNLTLAGTAKTSTAQYKFGTASLLLDGNSDYAKTSGYVGSITGGKTIECWVYAASISSKMCIWEWYEDDNNLLRLFFEGGNGNVLSLDQRNGGSTIVGLTGATTLSATTWYHLAATRTAAGAWKVYINGTADTDLSGSESGTTLDIRDIPLYLGVDFWATDRYWNGYIDDFRVSELDRYASGNFTAPTKAFADKGQ